MAGSSSARLVQLSAAGALAYCSYAMCRSPVLPLFARQLGASPAVVGTIVAASTLTGVVLKFPAGAVSDVVGRRAVLLAGAVVFAVLPWSYVAIAALGTLAVARVVHGSATALFGPVASATLSDLAPPDQRGRWLSVYAAAQGAGQAIGPVLAASLIVSNDFSGAFVVSAVLGTQAIMLLIGWPRSAGRATGHALWPQLRRGIRAVAADVRVLITSLAQAGQFFVNGTLSAFLPLYARESLDLSAPRIGWLFGMQTVATLCARPVFGALSDRIGRRPLIVAGLTICAACMAAIGRAREFSALLALTMVYGAGLALTTSATSAYVTDLSRRTQYGAAHGLFGTIYDIGDALGPICAGLLVARAGYALAFQLTGAVALAVAALFGWVSRHWEGPVDPSAAA